MNISQLLNVQPSGAKSKLDDENNAVTAPTTGATQTDSQTETDLSTGEEFTTFLTLLTAQIKNQDPLAPLDSTQFVEQLATFSLLELQAKGNNTLEEIANLLAQRIYDPAQGAASSS